MPFWLDIPYNVACNIYRENWILVVYKWRVLMNSGGWSVGRKTYLKYILLLVLSHTRSWIFDVNATGHLQTDIVTGILFFLDLYIYFSLLSSIFILTQYAVTYWCSITSFTLSTQVSILNKYFIMMLFISIFTINLSCNEKFFCLFKILFVCWQ